MENTINQWAETFSTLSDKQFSNIIRLYLGEVKTPYNKKRLTSQLASFINKPENTKAIIDYIDDFDVCVLTALTIIPNANHQLLIDFFSGDYSYSEIYTELENLKERLIIYTCKNPVTEKDVFLINPILEEKIKPVLNIGAVLPSPVNSEYSYDDTFLITPNFLLSFISYLKIHGCACKSDGDIKKNDMNRLVEIFGNKQHCLQLLFNAFVNLSILREGQKKMEVDNERLKAFAVLSFEQQLALLCAASCSRFSRDGLRKQAVLLLDCLKSIPETGFTRGIILRLAFLVGAFTSDGNAVARKGRFTQLLEAARSEKSENPIQDAYLLDRMIDSAIAFGLLQKTGETENGDDIYVSGNLQNVHMTLPDGELPKVLNIESTYSLSLMPGLDLAALLPFASFLNIKKCEVVTEFEITKDSVSIAFDEDWTPESIFEVLEKYTYHELPQSLRINVSEWYATYTSAEIYCGYVLKVSDKNVSFVENNPKIQRHIKQKIAEGIYLLDIPVNVDIENFISESGIDFLGGVRDAGRVTQETTFPVMRDGQRLSLLNRIVDADGEKRLFEAGGTLLSKLKAVLETMPLENNQKECLAYRISNRLILSEEQLKSASIRNEILEADGMDYVGKLHLIDAAITDSDKLELKLPDGKSGNEYILLLGKPLLLVKHAGDAVLNFRIEPDGEIENILVSRITHIRRLRF